MTKISTKASGSQARREWVELVTITPSIAEQWLQEFSYSGQRRINKNHVDFLAQEMAAGRFSTSEFRMVHENGKAFITNGQHRLHAVIQSDVIITATVLHREAGKEINGISEVALDYSTSDINKRRNISDALAATQIVHESGLAPTQFNRFAAALKPIIGGFAPGSYGSTTPIVRSFGIRLNAIDFWLETGRLFFVIAQGGERIIVNPISRQSILSVALVTLHYQHEKANEFWQHIIHNNGLKVGDPCRALERLLLTTPDRMKPTPEWSRLAAAGWNAFYEERDLKILKVHDAAAPIVLNGTPYDGKKVYTNTFEGDKE